MRTGSLVPRMGGEGEVVEIDETIYSRASTHPITNAAHKNVILSLVERGGEVRSYHVLGSTVSEVIPIVRRNIAKESTVMTDAAQIYKRQLADFANYDRVDHSKGEYANYQDGRPVIHTNTVEGYFSLFKRGMRGVYQHWKEKHLHCYLAEFDFRCNNRIALDIDDEQRAIKVLKGARGKQLTYRMTDRRVE